MKTDILILGSGFAGSLLALILNKMGRSCVVLDKAAHPRFTIGESSTPIGNMILRDLAIKYNLPQLLPLTTYGTWQEAYPHLTVGRKRGFSYFQHQTHQPFTPNSTHSNELLVTASTDNYRSDTHWLRADVDHFLVQEAQKAGVTVLENTRVTHLEQQNNHSWHIQARQNDEPILLHTSFLVDATGPAGLLGNYFQLANIGRNLHTNSHALFSHFEEIPPFHDYLASQGAVIEDHPYYCDDAAVHHIIDNGWLWMLRFNKANNLTSAGFVLNGNHYSSSYSVPPAEAWNSLTARYPTLHQLFADANLAPIPGKRYRTGRLQRLWNKAAGPGWAMLPHTAGFVDPLHSTGIAHSMSGIERLAALIEAHWDTPALSAHLNTYSQRVIEEIRFVDMLIAGCYPGMGQFKLLTTFTMLYFASAITYEERRTDAFKQGTPFTHSFLCVDEMPLRQIVSTAFNTLQKMLPTPSDDEISAFTQSTKEAIKPYNTASLFTPRIPNMYEYTAAEI